MADQLNCSGIGGSDAHIVSQIGKCGTKFDAPVNTIGELVEALRSNNFEAIKI